MSEWKTSQSVSHLGPNRRHPNPQGCWLLLSHINQRRFLPIDLISLWWNQLWQPWTVLIISTTCFPPLVHPSCAPTYWSCSARCQEPSAKQTESELINRCETRWGGLQKAGLAEGTCWQMQLPASGTAFLSFFYFLWLSSSLTKNSNLEL